MKKVSPAYTSVIGMLKYSPQFLIDKDTAGAYVIGRRGMGFEDLLSKNYEKLLSEKELLIYSLEVISARIERLKERVKEEKNKWKRKALREELKKLRKDREYILYRIKSLECDPATRERTSGGNKSVRGLPLGR